MEPRYWLVFPNGARQFIDVKRFDLATLTIRAAEVGAVLVKEHASELPRDLERADTRLAHDYTPPINALGPLFRSRFERIHACRVGYHLDINARATGRVLGGYYKRKRLVRVYARDRKTGTRPLEELFDTFLHEMAHHLEYTEPETFNGLKCGRVPGRMHSALFWRILSQLKRRWAEIQRGR